MSATLTSTGITFSDGTSENTAGTWVKGVSSGYRKLPDGTILQWGTYNAASGSVYTLTFPIAFPSTATTVLDTTDYYGPVYASTVTSRGSTGASIYIYGSGTAVNHYWFAIGY
jgi:hypothetical protein